jgi:hypothetical protein
MSDKKQGNRREGGGGLSLFSRQVDGGPRGNRKVPSISATVDLKGHYHEKNVITEESMGCMRPEDYQLLLKYDRLFISNP